MTATSRSAFTSIFLFLSCSSSFLSIWRLFPCGFRQPGTHKRNQKGGKEGGFVRKIVRSKKERRNAKRKARRREIVSDRHGGVVHSTTCQINPGSERPLHVPRFADWIPANPVLPDTGVPSNQAVAIYGGYMEILPHRYSLTFPLLAPLFYTRITRFCHRDRPPGVVAVLGGLTRDNDSPVCSRYQFFSRADNNRSRDLIFNLVLSDVVTVCLIWKMLF